MSCDNIAASSPGTTCSGPLHTNDELLACGSPTFGRNAQDRIESGNGWRSGGCSGVPNFQGTLIPDSSTIGMPATNASLATVARPAATPSRVRTTIKFGTSPGKITVTNLPTYNNTQMAYPSNGVIYVKASGSCPLYSALLPVLPAARAGHPTSRAAATRRSAAPTTPT